MMMGSAHPVSYSCSKTQTFLNEVFCAHQETTDKKVLNVSAAGLIRSVLRGVLRGTVFVVITSLALPLATEARADADADYRNIESVSEHPPDQFWRSLAQNAVTALGLDSKFNILWHLPETQLRENQIVFILFDSHEVDDLKSNPLIQNCRYFSAHETITCDISMLRLLAERFGIDKNTSIEYGPNGSIKSQSHTIYSREDLEPFYRNTLRWIVGHEFGHAFHGHIGTFSILSQQDSATTAEQLGNTAQPKSSATVNKCHVFEKEADNFFVSLLEEDDAFRIYNYLVNIFNNVKTAANCPKQPIGYTCEIQRSYQGTGVMLGPGVVQARVTATHPAFVLRVLDLLDKTWNGEGGFHLQFRDSGGSRTIKLRNKAYGGAVCVFDND